MYLKTIIQILYFITPRIPTDYSIIQQPCYNFAATRM